MLDELAKKLAAVLPQGVQQVQADLEKHFRAVLDEHMSRLNLVTREEFEVQQAVLQRTREQLDSLEAQLVRLEDEVSKSEPAD
jgi:ubiquinone biosynthesis accessory factor UbiK